MYVCDTKVRTAKEELEALRSSASAAQAALQAAERERAELRRGARATEERLQVRSEGGILMPLDFHTNC